MNPNENTMKFRQFHAQMGGPAPGPLGRILNALLSAVLLVVGFFFSLVAFAVAAVVGTLGAAWLWWKTRDLRREMRAQMENPPRPADGYVIEGEVIRDDTPTEAPPRQLPR